MIILFEMKKEVLDDFFLKYGKVQLGMQFILHGRNQKSP